LLAIASVMNKAACIIYFVIKNKYDQVGSDNGKPPPSQKNSSQHGFPENEYNFLENLNIRLKEKRKSYDEEIKKCVINFLNPDENMIRAIISEIAKTFKLVPLSISYPVTAKLEEKQEMA
jgi:hypothetical protein